MLRIVNSPFGRVLQAIRENDFRAEAIGYRTVVYRTLASVLSALFATLAGCLLALWLRYNGPDTSLSFEIMLDILLIVVIGGMGTMYGAVIGAVLFVIAQNYLQDLLQARRGRASRACRCWPRSSRPTAGCSGWACCSCCRSITSPPAWWGGCARCARPRMAERGMSFTSNYLRCEGRELHYTEWGAQHAETRDRLARPGAHRARHGRHRRAPVRSATA